MCGVYVSVECDVCVVCMSDVMCVWCRFSVDVMCVCGSVCDVCVCVGSDVMFEWCRFRCDVWCVGSV